MNRKRIKRRALMILYQQAVIIMIVVMIVPSILFVFYEIVAVNLINRLVFILLFNCFLL